MTRADSHSQKDCFGFVQEIPDYFGESALKSLIRFGSVGWACAQGPEIMVPIQMVGAVGFEPTTSTV